VTLPFKVEVRLKVEVEQIHVEHLNPGKVDEALAPYLIRTCPHLQTRTVCLQLNTLFSSQHLVFLSNYLTNLLPLKWIPTNRHQF